MGLDFSAIIESPAFGHSIIGTGCVISHDCSAVMTAIDEPDLNAAIAKAVDHWDQYQAKDFRDVERTVGNDVKFDGFIKLL